jgi:hypothetical protein
LELGSASFLLGNVNGVETINLRPLSGGTSLSLQSSVFGVTTIDGSAGNDTVTLNASVTSVSLNGQGGNDNFNLNNNTSSVTIDGGTGTNVVDLGLSTSHSLALVNVQTVQTYQAGSTTNESLTITNAVSGITSLNLGLGTDSLMLMATSGTNSIAGIQGVESITGNTVSAVNDILTFAAGLASGTIVDLGLGTGDAITLAQNSTNSASLTGVETANFNSTAMNSSSLTLTSGVSGLTLNGSSGTDTLTLGGTTGNSVTVNAALETVNGVATQNDVVTASQALTSLTFNGGTGGTDQLVLAINTTNTGVTLTGVEAIAAGEGGSGTAESLTLAAAVTGITSVDLGTGVGTDALVLANGTNTISGIASVETITGGTGVDTLTISSGGSTITGGGGADVLTLATGAGAGTDTVRYTAAGDGGDSVTNFAQGAGADIFNFASALLVNGTKVATLLELTATNGTIGVNDVFIELGGANFGATDTGTAAGAATVISALTDTNIAGGDKLLVAMDDNTDSYLWYYQEDGVDTTTAATSELTQMAKVVGLADAAGFADGDFTFS